MVRTLYGKDASACESLRDLETRKWISVVRHKLPGGVPCDLFGHFDSKGDADAHAAKVVRALNDPGLLESNTKAYKDAMARRDKVLALHESLGRVSDGGVRKKQGGTYIGELRFNGKLVRTLTHAERGGAKTELASLRSTLLRGGTVEEHRLRHKAERVRRFHAEGTPAREEMEDLLEKERNGTNGNTRVGLTRDGHVPVRERWNGKMWVHLCSTPRCMKQRQGGNTKSDKCHACGGGNRCQSTACKDQNTCGVYQLAVGAVDADGKRNVQLEGKWLCLNCLRTYDPANATGSDKYARVEQHVLAELQRRLERFPEILAKLQKRVWDCALGPSQRRPDYLLELPKFEVLLEVDEFQHGGYSTSCERLRVSDLMTDRGAPGTRTDLDVAVQRLVDEEKRLDKPFVVVRFNPDGYTDESGKEHRSMFGAWQSHQGRWFHEGVSPHFEERMDALVTLIVDTVRKYEHDAPKKELTTFHLYYCTHKNGERCKHCDGMHEYRPKLTRAQREAPPCQSSGAPACVPCPPDEADEADAPEESSDGAAGSSEEHARLPPAKRAKVAKVAMPPSVGKKAPPGGFFPEDL